MVIWNYSFNFFDIIVSMTIMNSKGGIMEYRQIGQSELKASVVSLGTWVFGGECWGEADDTESIKAVNAALDAGINLIDTAPVYGNGRSEEVIGKAIKGREKEIIIATKCGLEQKGKSIRPNLKPEFIEEEINNSLRRLGVETIDLYQCHWPDPRTPLEETFNKLNDLVKEGKIRYIGVSNFNADLLKEALKFSSIESDQMHYSLFERSIEKEIIPVCEDSGVSILAYGTLGGGILTGKYKEPPQISKGDVRSFFYKYYKEPFWSKAREMIDVLEDIAVKHDSPVSNAAINWVLNKKIVASCIAGSRNLEQIRKNAEAANWTFDNGEFEVICNRYKELF
jgi:aryl-alcohol dehydrogenase-like predicted oxidoreductase